MQFLLNRALLLILFGSMTNLPLVAQSQLLLNTYDIKSPLVFEGSVTVIHSPDHYYTDTTEIKYLHYLVIDKVQDTIIYREIYKTEYRDSLVSESFNFLYKADEEVLLFPDENEFLSFSKIGKLLFLFEKFDNDQESHLTIPRRHNIDPNKEWNVNIDTSYFFNFMQIRGSDTKSILTQNLDIERRENGFLIAAQFSDKSYTATDISSWIPIVKDGRVYQRSESLREIEWTAILDENKRYQSITKQEYYKSKWYKRTNENKTFSHYKRLDSIPEDIKDYLDSL